MAVVSFLQTKCGEFLIKFGNKQRQKNTEATYEAKLYQYAPNPFSNNTIIFFLVF